MHVKSWFFFNRTMFLGGSFTNLVQEILIPDFYWTNKLYTCWTETNKRHNQSNVFKDILLISIDHYKSCKALWWHLFLDASWLVLYAFALICFFKTLFFIVLWKQIAWCFMDTELLFRLHCLNTVCEPFNSFNCFFNSNSLFDLITAFRKIFYFQVVALSKRPVTKSE